MRRFARKYSTVRERLRFFGRRPCYALLCKETGYEGADNSPKNAEASREDGTKRSIFGVLGFATFDDEILDAKLRIELPRQFHCVLCAALFCQRVLKCRDAFVVLLFVEQLLPVLVGCRSKRLRQHVSHNHAEQKHYDK